MNAVNAPGRYVCVICHKTYGRKFDLERHRKIAHPETEDSETDDSESDDMTSVYEHLLKRPRLGKTMADESEESTGEESDEEEEQGEGEEKEDSEDENVSAPQTEDPEDNLAYQNWFEQAMTATDELRNMKVERYIDEDWHEKEAKEKAHVKFLWAVKRIFFNHYSQFLHQSVYLEQDDTHQEILSDLQAKIDKGMGVKKAVSRVLAKHRGKFDALFTYQDEDDEDQGDDEEEEED